MYGSSAEAVRQLEWLEPLSSWLLILRKASQGLFTWLWKGSQKPERRRSPEGNPRCTGLSQYSACITFAIVSLPKARHRVKVRFTVGRSSNKVDTKIRLNVQRFVGGKLLWNVMGRELGKAGRTIRAPCKSDPEWWVERRRSVPGSQPALQSKHARQGCWEALQPKSAIRGVPCLPGVGLP